MKKKFVIVGAGYVGMSLGVLFGQDNQTTILELDQKKVNLINKQKSPVEDEEITKKLQSSNLNLSATLDPSPCLAQADYIVIAAPTNFDETTQSFDTSSVESILTLIADFNNFESLVVIKSTVPIGFTRSMQLKFRTENIVFSPEFLREGRALHDNLYPSRIIIGDSSKKSKDFTRLLKKASLDPVCQTLYMQSDEAEATKLFSNAFLAMRISFFNEVDNYAISKNLNAKNIIEGISHDPRIGNYYNNPSFGYGGYCLPKDTKQLSADFQNVPHNVIQACIDSNNARKSYIIEQICSLGYRSIGIFRLNMKKDSDNLRESSIIDIIHGLKKKNISILI